MNREFLEERGIGDEVIGEILAEHQRLVDELKAEMESRLSDKEREMEDLRTDFAIDRELTGLGARNLKAVKALLDMEALRSGENGLDGLGEQLEKIRRENGYLFADRNTPVVTGPTAPRTNDGFGFRFTGVR